MNPLDSSSKNSSFFKKNKKRNVKYDIRSTVTYGTTYSICICPLIGASLKGLRQNPSSEG